MKSIMQERLGEASDVFQVVEQDQPSGPSTGTALIRMEYAAIHPGDLLAAAGSPAFSTDPVAIPVQGRVPGLEGVGVIEGLAVDVDPALGLAVGQRVVLFRGVRNMERKRRGPGGVPFARSGRYPRDGCGVDADRRDNRIDDRPRWASAISRRVTPVLQTGAGSAVARLLTILLLERGYTPIRLVRTPSSAAALQSRLAGPPVLATEEAGWMQKVASTIGGRPLPVALDGVGGALLASVARCVDVGGTIVNYGALGGTTADIRLFVPRSLTMLGVTIGAWGARNTRPACGGCGNRDQTGAGATPSSSSQSESTDRTRLR